MVLKPSALFYAPLPSRCTECYRWKAIVQVSLVSIVYVGTTSALFGCLHHHASAPRSPLRAKLGSVAGYVQNFWTCWMSSPSLAEVFFFHFCIFFCIEIYRSPSHLLPHLLSPSVSVRPKGCGWARSSSSSAACAPAEPAQERAAASPCTMQPSHPV